MAVKENGEYPTLQDMDPTKGQTVLYEKMAIILDAVQFQAVPQAVRNAEEIFKLVAELIRQSDAEVTSARRRGLATSIASGFAGAAVGALLGSRTAKDTG